MRKSDYKVVLGYLGLFTSVIGAITLIPLVVLFFHPEELAHGMSFLLPALGSFAFGIPLSLFLKKTKNQKLSLRQDTVIVLMVWIMASFISAIPFIISGKLGIVAALFESVSSWTTTGFSVVDIENIERIFLFHRSVIQFFGGVGIVLILSSALSSTFGMRLYSAEGHSDKLLPNLVSSSRLIMGIYSGYILLGTVLYVVFGMSVFDAINHSMAALSTGGFGVKTDNIGSYNSLEIEVVTMLLMILGTTNFAVHLLLLGGRFKKALRVGEVRFMFFILGVSLPIMVFIALRGVYGGFGESLRAGSFQVISALSTSGFSTVDFKEWSSFSNFIIIILMTIGGGAGSASGGIKLYRVYIMIKSAIWNMKKSFMSESVVREDYVYTPSGKQYIDSAEACEINRYGFIYMSLLVLGTAALTAYGYPLEYALFEFSSAIGTAGLSVGITAAEAPTGVLLVEMAGMIFGRLEIYAVFIAIMKMFKRFK